MGSVPVLAQSSRCSWTPAAFDITLSEQELQAVLAGSTYRRFAAGHAQPERAYGLSRQTRIRFARETGDEGGGLWMAEGVREKRGAGAVCATPSRSMKPDRARM